MNFFAQLKEQLAAALGSEAAARRVMLLGVVAASIGGLLLIFAQARTGSYKNLYENLAPADAAEAATKLRALDIPAKFANDGTTLQVPTSKWDQALMTLAQEGFPGSGTIGYELMDKSSIGLSDFEQKMKYHRSLEGELARTIMTIRQIERAKVHLALPKPSLFLKEKAEPSASVVLRTRGSAPLDEKEIAGIAQLVAHAVEGLSPSAVSIIDSKGEMLNRPEEQAERASLTNRISYKIDYENRLKEEIETMLAKTVGPGKVSARVNADFDFSQKTRVEETYDPDSKVIRKENVRGEGMTLETPVIQEGGAGSDTNLPPGDPATAEKAENPTKTKVDRETTYELSRTSAQTVETVPLLQRLTVSVLVDGHYKEAAEGATGEEAKPEFSPRTPEEMAILRETVQNIIGYSEERAGGLSDQISVASVQFQLGEGMGDEEPIEEKMFNQDMIRELVQWGVVTVIGLLLIFTVLRPAVRGVTISPARQAASAGLPGPGAGEAQGALPEGQWDQGAAGGPAGGQALPHGAGAAQQGAGAASAQPLAYETSKARQLEEEVGRLVRADFDRTTNVVRQWMDES